MCRYSRHIGVFRFPTWASNLFPPFAGGINSQKGTLALSAAVRLVALRHTFRRRLGSIGSAWSSSA